jgi:hypothetical protein
MSRKPPYISDSLLTPVSNGLSFNKDPRGLVNADLEKLRQVFKPLKISPNSTIEEIMFNAGQQSVMSYIEANLVPKYS